MTTRKKFTAIDLFSGCGGLSWGLRRAGFTVKAAVEINELATKAYKSNHRDVPVINRDIRLVSMREIKRHLNGEPLDLLAGCPPCQGFSRLRENCNSDDSRNDLVNRFAELVIELRPRSVLLENVPGLMDDYRFVNLLSILESLNYSVDFNVLDAANFGVPQRRKRLILMASRLGDICLPTGSPKKMTVRRAIGKLKTKTVNLDKLRQMHMKNSERIFEKIKRIPHDGGSRKDLGAREQLACHKRAAGFNDIYGRMKWDDVSPTLTSGCYNPSKGRFLHPTKNRAITLREAACLQSFLTTYKFPAEAGLAAIARLIGDALPPRFAYAQAKHLIAHLESYK